MLSVIFGKPGSGKSYYAVRKISDMLVDFFEFEKREGRPHKRKIYTNLPLKIDALNDFVSRRCGFDCDCSNYVQYLDQTFFDEETSAGKFQRVKWWKKFEEGAYIVIDEVQNYLGNFRESGDSSYLKEFQEYISYHRHYQHDLVFITQHTDNINKICLNMAEDAFHVVNIKSRVLPFFGIPFADIDVIKESFGIKNQYIQILYGNYIGRAFKRESTFYELLRPEIYALYSSHNLKDGEASDRPSLKMSPPRAIFWFIRKHFWNIFIKCLIVYFVFYICYSVIAQLPFLVSDNLSKKLNSKIQANKNNQADEPIRPMKEKPVPARPVRPVSRNAGDVGAPAAPPKIERTTPKVEIITPDYVKINGKRYFVNDKFEWEGVFYVVEKIDFDKLSVDFGLCKDKAAGAESKPDELQLTGPDTGDF